MATFRCIQSGNTVTFTFQHDIDSMRGHTGYVRVDDPVPQPVEEPVKQVVIDPPKRIGRPPKQRGSDA